MKFQDLSGQKFGDLIVWEIYDKKRYGQNIYIRYLCKCVCGNETIVSATNLRSKIRGIKSCGCHRNGEQNKTHGMTRSLEFNSWVSMKQRCYNENAHGYEYYGRIGIKVCDRWLNSFENFYEDMGKRPSIEYTIERIDGDKNYESDNCYWGTKEEQANNISSNRKYYYNGEELSIAQWSRKLNISYGVLYGRLRRGIPFEEAIEKMK